MHLGRVPWLTASGGANISHDNFAHYANVNVSLLALHGSADTSTDPEGTRELVAAPATEDKEFVLLEDFRHLLLDDLRSDQIRSHSIEWLVVRTPDADRFARWWIDRVDHHKRDPGHRSKLGCIDRVGRR